MTKRIKGEIKKVVLMHSYLSIPAQKKDSYNWKIRFYAVITEEEIKT